MQKKKKKHIYPDMMTIFYKNKVHAKYEVPCSHKVSIIDITHLYIVTAPYTNQIPVCMYACVRACMHACMYVYI